ncbi:MAG: ImmA/IrrE family metallo-endopeptidase [Prevotella sp.]|nr:ImmA/IrrE family metallo-endopeptidase [Prevotella sp.]
MFKPKFRLSKTGVPILSHEDIEKDAEFFIEDYDRDLLTHPGEFDVEKFSELYMDLDLRFHYLSSYGGVLGVMVFNNDDYVPIYNPENGRAEWYQAERGEMLIENSLLSSEHRLRYTVGHEDGHWIYHQNYYRRDPYQMSLFSNMQDSYRACRASDLQLGCEDKIINADHYWMEHQANYFSAALLMPRKTMRIICHDARSRKGGMMDMIAEVSDVFNVSRESARIRIEQLGLGIEGQDDSNAIFLYGE